MLQHDERDLRVKKKSNRRLNFNPKPKPQKKLRKRRAYRDKCSMLLCESKEKRS